VLLLSLPESGEPDDEFEPVEAPAEPAC